jgi:hypothetical protein
MNTMKDSLRWPETGLYIETARMRAIHLHVSHYFGSTDSISLCTSVLTYQIEIEWDTCCTSRVFGRGVVLECWDSDLPDALSGTATARARFIFVLCTNRNSALSSATAQLQFITSFCFLLSPCTLYCRSAEQHFRCHISAEHNCSLVVTTVAVLWFHSLVTVHSLSVKPWTALGYSERREKHILISRIHLHMGRNRLLLHRTEIKSLIEYLFVSFIIENSFTTTDFNPGL